ncbi:endopeptidase La [Seongchinamella sediminis]|uniref:Lon protease n=1 Tax=Seongchinamella sediminis TaxID=2283635 RepID=A0A3L7E410_9GAMM|nr:endopeptidase La [Seongchinamella sediminis]RLQ23112.1 endopeptidase La [Seongchinamella sediminis]
MGSSSVIELPLLPLRDVVVYPHMVLPLFVGREKSIEALEDAMANDKQVLLVAQRDAADDNPGADDIYQVGTVSNILQLLKLPDGTIKVLVEGGFRAAIDSVDDEGEFAVASVREIVSDDIPEDEAEGLLRSTNSQFEKYVNLSKKVPAEVLTSLTGIDEPGRLADTIAAHMSVDLEEKQRILEISGIRARLEHLMGLMEAEIDLFQVEKRIRGRVKKQMEKSQREYYLNEQMKAIQKELGEMDEAPNELDELQSRIDEAKMPAEAKEKAEAELGKLKMMSPMSAEASVVRSYIDWMVSVPWAKRSKVKHDLKRATRILDEDHYGLDEVKDRIIEYLAVQKRVRKVKGPVLCLVGPPGVGKTSLGESIARSTNRKFVRMALGGVRDEAEIRGHRRTYIGSMPGKLLQKMAKAGVRNPLFLLDEIDKMGMDHRGDPASAMLEVLDPEQNHAFNDHYLEVDYDLSDVMFVCTSNTMNIPGPLLDRMEVIRIPGYTEDEKLNIAERYLIPKQVKLNGLKKDELFIAPEAVTDIIRYYTREAGVRSLEREIAKVCRKMVKAITLEEAEGGSTVTPEMLSDLLGVRKYNYGIAEEENKIGQVTGLAWTSVGGELLTIEAVAVAGKGRHVKTGSLGDVMQESIQAATTVVRSRSQMLGIPANYHEKHDVHIHVPEGATPKDGPSAGVAMCTALVSVLTEIPVRADVAMTGEITLRGEVLPIGGLKEKLLAARRGGIKTVIIPKENERDLKEIPDNIKEHLNIRAVKWIDEVLAIALESMPKPLSDEEYLASGITGGGEESEDEKNRINTH